MTHVVLHAPYRNGRNLILAGSLSLATGDELRVEATVTPEAIAKARNLGQQYGAALMAWAQEHIELVGDWGAGPFGKAAAAVIARVGMHPVLTAPGVAAGKAVREATKRRRADVLVDLPTVAVEDANMLSAAHKTLRQPDCGRLLRQAQLLALQGDQNAWRLVGAIHDAGVCCCNRLRIKSRYDLDTAVQQSPGTTPSSIAVQASNEMAARSRQSLKDDGHIS